MGVGIGDIIPKKEKEIEHFKGRKIAIDAYNTLYQFLSIIRQRDGTPLMDSKGRITSHLSGILYRTGKLVKNGVKPVYVFDGEPPKLKKGTIDERKKNRREAREKFKKAMKEGKGKEARKYAQQSVKLTGEILKTTKDILNAMGIPHVQAPGEGEAQAAYICKKGRVWAASSQDYDALLYGSPTLVRNLTITGKRKLPGKNQYVTIKPEEIKLEEVFKELKIDQKGLIEIGLMVGTDYNKGIDGVGPKTALKKAKKGIKAEEVYREKNQEPEVDLEKLRDLFKNPQLTDDYKLKWRKPDQDKMKEILVEKHDFSQDRVVKVAKEMEKVLSERTTQMHLGG